MTRGADRPDCGRAGAGLQCTRVKIVSFARNRRTKPARTSVDSGRSKRRRQAMTMGSPSAAAVVIAVAAFLLLPGMALATQKVSISGTHSRAELKSQCDAVGGMCGNCGGTKGSYGCDNPDGGTSIGCTSAGKCTGWLPDRVSPGRGLGGILTPPAVGAIVPSQPPGKIPASPSATRVAPPKGRLR